MNLFEMCYKRRKLPIIRKKIPFFLDFITFIVKNAIKVCKCSSSMNKWNSLSGKFNISFNEFYDFLNIHNSEKYFCFIPEA